MTANSHRGACVILTFASITWALTGFVLLAWPRTPLLFVSFCAGMTVLCSVLAHRHYLRAEEIERAARIQTSAWRAGS